MEQRKWSTAVLKPAIGASAEGVTLVLSTRGPCLAAVVAVNCFTEQRRVSELLQERDTVQSCGVVCQSWFSSDFAAIHRVCESARRGAVFVVVFLRDRCVCSCRWCSSTENSHTPSRKHLVAASSKCACVLFLSCFTVCAGARWLGRGIHTNSGRNNVCSQCSWRRSEMCESARKQILCGLLTSLWFAFC